MRHFKRSPRAFPLNAQAIPETVTNMSKYVNPILEKYPNGLSFIWGTELKMAASGTSGTIRISDGLPRASPATPKINQLTIQAQRTSTTNC